MKDKFVLVLLKNIKMSFVDRKLIKLIEGCKSAETHGFDNMEYLKFKDLNRLYIKTKLKRIFFIKRVKNCFSFK